MMKIAVLDLGTIFAKIFKSSIPPQIPAAPSPSVGCQDEPAALTLPSVHKTMPLISSSFKNGSSVPNSPRTVKSNASPLALVTGLKFSEPTVNRILVRPAPSSCLVTLNTIKSNPPCPTAAIQSGGRALLGIPENFRRSALGKTEASGMESRHPGRKSLSKGSDHQFIQSQANSLPLHFTSHVVGAIQNYQRKDSIPSDTSSGQTTLTDLNNSWSEIHSYATCLSTERSSVYSWRDDEFDKVNTQKIRQLFWDVDEMLFESKVSSRTQGLQTECKEWTTRSPHLRILGTQLMLPKDDGFQHFHRRNTSEETSSQRCLDNVSDIKEMFLSGQRLEPSLSPVHSALISPKSLFSSDTSVYSFLEEEIFESDGKIEEYFAFDCKEIEDEVHELRRIPKRNKCGVPPVSPHACIKDAVTAEVFDDVWRETVEILEELIRKHWESDLPDEDSHMINVDNSNDKMLLMPPSQTAVDDFTVSPSRSSDARIMSWSNLLPHRASRIQSAFNSNLNGVMTIQAKPLQHRYSGLLEKTQSEIEDKATSNFNSSCNRISQLNNSILSSSKMPNTIFRKPPSQRKLPALNSDALRLKTVSDEVLRGIKINTGTDCLSSSSSSAMQSMQKKQLPTIHSETLEQRILIPGSRHLQCKGKTLHNRVLSAVPESTSHRPLRERAIVLDPLSRPKTTHTFRSDTLFKRSLTPMDFASHTRFGKGSFTGEPVDIGVTGFSVGAPCLGSSTDPLLHHQRHNLSQSITKDVEGECQPSWGPHNQTRAFNRNSTFWKKKYQMVSS
ncbi:protein FAM149A isoform X1 [Polypterus senegalus]|uniref:protein FAM149A isoform X1 n=1 Tax=Polypterus senegalus TaxID=55291 RepID=UPI00196667CB|nr:protein FAM149A isoform X1 [Polypterus senegalus]